ncbi:MAG: hypothetical protein ABFS45_13810, partial [Pseudomonadota bacterium]
RSLIFVSLFLAYHANRTVLIALFSFPVAVSFVISGLLIDPSIPSSDKLQLYSLIIDRFDQVFQYSIVLSLLLALAVVLLGLFKYLLDRVNGQRSIVAEELGH